MWSKLCKILPSERISKSGHFHCVSKASVYASLFLFCLAFIPGDYWQSNKNQDLPPKTFALQNNPVSVFNNASSLQEFSTGISPKKQTCYPLTNYCDALKYEVVRYFIKTFNLHLIPGEIIYFPNFSRAPPLI